MLQPAVVAECSFPGARRFIVTGLIQKRTRIPNSNHDTEGDVVRAHNRVTVPSHMWTAVCCDSSGTTNPADGFSFAYIGENSADSYAKLMNTSELEENLPPMSLGPIAMKQPTVFVDDCNENSAKSNLARDLVSVPMDKRVANAMDDLSTEGGTVFHSSKETEVHS